MGAFVFALSVFTVGFWDDVDDREGQENYSYYEGKLHITFYMIWSVKKKN